MAVLEQEIASIIRYILDASPGVSPYYWKLPQDFLVPAVYFPPPVFTMRGETFLTYALEYDWFIKFAAGRDEDAQALAATALNALSADRRLVPLIDEQGERTGRLLRLKDPELKQADDNAYQLELRWDSRRPYNRQEYEKMMTYDLSIYTDDAYRAAITQITG